ncbi:MAG TPA: immunoglobulin domain-containing protein [Bacteroidales bacterium]|nr:immunoglobulin domain-containing protein [Bacteroidales bacterium]
MKDLKSFKNVLFTALLGAFILVNCQSKVYAYGITSIGGSGWSGTLNYSANSTIYVCYSSSVTLYSDVTDQETVGSVTYYKKWQYSSDGVSWVTTSSGGGYSTSSTISRYYRCVQRSTGGVVLAGSETPWVRIMFGPSFVQMPSAVSTTDVSGTSFTAHWTTSSTAHGPGNLAIRHWMFCSTTSDFQSGTQAPGFNTSCAKLITACSEATSAIAGCTSPSTPVSYTVTGLTPGVTYYWKVIAQSYHEESSNGDLYCGVQSSYTGTQTVNSCPPPVITAQPLAQTVCEGQSVSFSVTATGATSYQWQLTGSDISGATNSSYNIPSVSSGNAGNYQCIVTNACGSVTSNSVTLTIGTEVTPAFSAIGPYCVGATPGTLPATSTNGISGTWAPATITTATSGTTTYTFTPTAGQCATTASVQVTVSDPVTPVITGTTSLCTGSNATWTGSIPGGTWASETPGAATAGSTTGLITGVAAGTSVITYSVSSGGCVNTATQTVTVSVSTPQTITGTNPVCLGSSATWTGTSPGGTWTSDAQIIATIDPVTGLVSGINTGTSLITYAVNVGGCVNTATETVLVSAVLPTDVTVAANPAGPVCSGTVVQFTATPLNGGVAPTYEWYKFGTHVGSNSPVYVDSTLVIGDKISCRMTSGQSCVSGNPGLSDTIFMIVKPSLIASIGIEGSAGAPCESLPADFTATPVNGGTSPAYQWYLNTTAVSTTSVYSNSSLVTGDSIRCRLTSNEACVVNNPTWSNTIHISVSPVPTAEAGANASYTGTPVVLGDPSNGPGTFSWSPATGLSDPLIAQPSATPAVTTTYTLSVNNNGCISTDEVTITVGGSGHTISGKTVYAGKANAGNPVPNNPTYNPVIYAINQVIVILKSSPANDEVARDTSDASGIYQFTNIADGNYILAYDKYTADTMLWGNDVTAIDVALLKYFIGSDSLQDPTRCFSLRYKSAANVDNNASINAVDVARIKAKVGAPYDVTKNFPRGNWVAFDKPVTVAGSDLNVNLETICYGDYNASSSKYRDSLTNWSGAKSIPAEIIVTSEDYVATSDAGYFEIPLRVSSKMNEFSALGLELNYPEGYQLVSANMPAAANKSGNIKINPAMEEIISGDNDLLVTDDGRVIRVVFATTDHFDVAAGEVMIVLGFRAINLQSTGTAEFMLSGTGVIGNQYGEVNDDTYLIMPRVLIQGSANTTGFEFAGYPNPFSGDATLTYQIPEKGTVNIKVFNVLGELVTVLINESQPCGRHTIDFSGKNFPAGIYSFKLEFEGLHNSGREVLKMIR